MDDIHRAVGIARASGKRLFQAKTIILDSKAVYQPEPEETAAEITLQS